MALLCGFLFVACFFDYRYQKIPNLIPISVLILGIEESIRQGGMEDLAVYIVRVILVTAVLYPVFRIGGLGAGDVKLFGVSAGFFPMEKMIWFLFVAFLIGGVISLVRMILWGDAKERMSYCIHYFLDVLRSGKWTLYKQFNGDTHTGICLAGPMFLSAAFCLGGLY